MLTDSHRLAHILSRMFLILFCFLSRNTLRAKSCASSLALVNFSLNLHDRIHMQIFYISQRPPTLCIHTHVVFHFHHAQECAAQLYCIAGNIKFSEKSSNSCLSFDSSADKQRDFVSTLAEII